MILAGRLILIGTVTSAILLATAPAMAETIFGAMAKAYNNNSTLNANRAGVRVFDEGVAIAKSGYRPVVSATAALTATDRRLDDGRNGARQEGTFGLTINQTLFDGFTVSNNIESAKTQVLAARENLRNDEQNLLFSAAQAYMNVYLTRQIVILRQRNLKFLDEQLRAAQARFDVGEGTRTDVAQAQASKASAMAALDAAKSDEKTAEATYIQVIGAGPDKLRPAEAPSRSLPRSMDEALALALNSHPAIFANQYAVDAAGYGVKANEGQLLPQVGLAGSVNRNEIFSGSVLTPGTDSTSSSASLRVTVPIYNGGRTSALIRRSKETLAQRRIEVDVARDSVRQAVVQAYSQMVSATAQIVAQRSVVAAARLALNGVIEERNVGQRTTLDVLNQQAGVLTGEINLARAERDRVVTSFAVLSAVGHLTASQIGLQVTRYKPGEHYDAVKDRWIGLRTPDGR